MSGNGKHVMDVGGVPIIGSASRARTLLIDCPSGLDDDPWRHLFVSEEGDVRICRPCSGTGKIWIQEDLIPNLTHALAQVRNAAAHADRVRAEAAAQAEKSVGEN